MNMKRHPGFGIRNAGKLCARVILLISFVSTIVHAQRDHPSFSFDHLTVDDGLSYSTVHTLIQDDLGMIWAGTRFGLNRYDGYEFKVYLPDPTDPDAIRSQAILSLSLDAQNNLWIGHLNGGISVRERSTGRFLKFPFLPDTLVDWNTITVRSVFEDASGHLWIGTYGAGAIVFDSTGRRMTQFCSTCMPENRKINNDFVFNFLSDPEGRIWIGHAGNGMHVYDPSTDLLQVVHGTDSQDMDGFSKSLCLGQGNLLWVGTEGSGLYAIDRSSLTVTRHFPGTDPGTLNSPMITDLLADRQGNLWIGTDGGGCNKFSPGTQLWEHFRYEPDFLNSLNSDALYDLMLDDAQNLWIGTFNGGINVHKAEFPPFVMDRRYAEERAVGLRSVLSIEQNADGTVWLGTDGGGLFQLDVSTTPLRLYPAGAPSEGMRVITSLASAGGNLLWVGTFARGLYLFDAVRGEIRHYLNDPADHTSLSHNNVWDLEPDAAGGVWIATLGAGVSHLLPDQKTFERYLPEEGNINTIAGTQIIDIALDRIHHRLWVASENSGLSVIDFNTTPYTIRQFHHHPDDSTSLVSEKLRCLYLEDDGTLWIGTENAGLCAWNPAAASFRHFSIAHGLPSNMINSIVRGPQGFLWISTQAGMIRWKSDASHVFKIGAEPFLENNQYNPRAALQLRDGRIILGTTNGYSILLPEQVRINQTPPEVVFTELIVSNQQIPIGDFNGRTILTGPLNDPGSKVSLSYQDKGINLRFTSTDFSQPDKNQFAYRLMHFDTTWRVVGPDERFATFSSLPGGNYELQVKAANRDGIWSLNPRKLSIQVAPPFWKTWWFVLSMILLGLLFLGSVVAILLIRQKNRYHQQAYEARQEILRLQNESLEKDVLSKQAQLSASVLQNAHKNQLLGDIKAQIQKIESDDSGGHGRDLHRISRSIDSELSQQDYWEQFQLTFNQVHQDFMHKLHETHPQISPTEIRLCCFIRMGLSNAEISSIHNITVNGVEQSKYRLKKKLGLEKSASLNDYIMSL